MLKRRLLFNLIELVITSLTGSLNCNLKGQIVNIYILKRVYKLTIPGYYLVNWFYLFLLEPLKPLLHLTIKFFLRKKGRGDIGLGGEEVQLVLKDLNFLRCKFALHNLLVVTMNQSIPFYVGRLGGGAKMNAIPPSPYSFPTHSSLLLLSCLILSVWDHFLMPKRSVSTAIFLLPSLN